MAYLLGSPNWVLCVMFASHHNGQSNYNPMVKEAELLEAMPQYVHVHLCDGHAAIVSHCNVTPRGYIDPSPNSETLNSNVVRYDGEHGPMSKRGEEYIQPLIYI